MAGGGKVAISTPKLNGIQVQTSLYGSAIPRGWGTFRVSGNLMWYDDFQAIAKTQKASGGGKGGGKVSNTTYSYKASLVMAVAAGPIAGIRKIFRDQSVLTSLTGSGLSLATGAIGQAPWGYLTSKHPSKDIGYSGVAYVYGQGYPLTDGAVLPNHSFEVQSTIRVAGLDDANPAEIIPDFLSQVPFWGTGLVGSLTDYSNFCLASDFLISPVLDAQTQGAQFLKELLLCSNSDCVWSDGVLKVVPLGDEQVTANGVTWNPNLQPIYDITEDDYLQDGEEDPLTYELKRPADSYNYVQIKYRDRAHQYNDQIVPGIDQANIDEFGQRKKDPEYLSAICRTSVATKIAQIMVQRSCNVRAKYKFRLPWNYCLLEPLDLVTITSSRLGLTKQLVRIEEIAEDDEGELEFIVEEVLVGVAQAAAVTRQEPNGYQSNFDIAPGNTTAPVLFTPPPQLTGGELEVWLAMSGGTWWGGAEVWVSLDDVSYERRGTWRVPARYGATASALPSVADPDATSVLSVDLTPSRGELTAASQAEVDDFVTICLVGSEVIAYRGATLTATNKYNLSYLRRGLFGTAPASHLSGAQFVRLDDAVMQIGYRLDQVGGAMYVKLRSFNVFGRALQDLADVSPYIINLSPKTVAAPAASSVTAVAGSETGPSGTRTPTIVVTSTASDSAADSLVIRYRTGAAGWSYHPRVNYISGAASLQISAIQPETLYNIEAAHIIDGVLGAFLALPNVTTGSIVSTDVSPGGGTPPADVAGTPTILLSTLIQPDGSQITRMTASCAVVANAAGYIVEIDNGTTAWTIPLLTNSITNHIVPTGPTYRVRFKAVSRTEVLSVNWSAYSGSLASGGDTTAPGNPTGVAITALARRLVLSWTPFPDADYSHLKLYRNTTGNSPVGEGDLYQARVTGSIFADTNVSAGTVYYYWAKPVDRTGNVGALNYFGTATPTFIRVDLGDVRFDDPALVTNYGTAAAYTGQTAWGTYGGSTNRVQYLSDTGLLDDLTRVVSRPMTALTGRTADNLTYVSGGATVESLRPGEANANVTESRTAASITGQTRFATVSSLSLADADVYAPWGALESRPAVTQGNSLTEDAAMADASCWVDASGTFTTVTDGRVARTVFRGTSGTMMGARHVPVDRDKTYMVEGWYRSIGAHSSCYAGVDLQDGSGNTISEDGTFYLYSPAGVTITNDWTYFSRIFGAGTSKPIPTNGRQMRPLFYPNYSGTGTATEVQGLRIVEVIRIGGSLYRADGTLASEAQVITSLGTAASIAGQAATATSSDFSAVTGATRPANNATVGSRAGINLFRDDGVSIMWQSEVRTSEGVAASISGQAPTATSSDYSVITGATRPANNAGTSGTLTVLGSHTTAVGNFVQKSNVTGTHGAWQGGVVGPAQRGSCFISGSIISAGMGYGWLTCYALDDDGTSFVDSQMLYRIIVSDSGVGTGSVYMIGPAGQTANISGIPITTASRAMIAYDGTTVKAIIDGVVHLSVDAPAGLRLWPKMLDYYISQSSAAPSGVVDIQHGTYTENTVSTVTLIPFTAGVINGSTATKVNGDNGSWSNGGARSRERYTGSAACTFKIGISNQPYQMMGLASSGFDGVYNTLNYALFVENGPSSVVRVYESGNDRGVVVAANAWALTDVWSIVYDGTYVRYHQNGVVIYTSTAQAAGQSLGFGCSHVYNGNQTTDIQIGSAQQAARLGQNTYDDSGGALIPRTNLITSIGVAASYAGQTPLATQSFPTYNGVAAAKAAGLTDGRQFYDSSQGGLLVAVTSAAGGFGASADATSRSGSTTSGAVTTSTVTVTPTGASGTVTYEWYRTSGDAGITATSPTGSATAFSGSVAAGETKNASFACAVKDAGSGKTVTLLCNAVLISTV